MAKELLSATVERTTMDKVRKIMKEDKRPSQSNAVQILLDEAIAAREKKKLVK
jgi:hypothetical protein